MYRIFRIYKHLVSEFAFGFTIPLLRKGYGISIYMRGKRCLKFGLILAVQALEHVRASAQCVLNRRTEK
jgi:hypothetical protein